MSMKKMVLFLCCLTAQTLIWGMYNYQVNTYKSIPIEPGTILALAPKVPKKIKRSVLKWVENHKDILKQLLANNYPFSKCKRKREADNELLRLYGIVNWSQWNYIMPLTVYEEQDYCIQLSGPIIRRGNIATYNGTCCDDMVAEDIDALTIIPTYQTLSRLAYYLRFVEFCQRERPSSLATLPTYVLYVPWATGNRCDDEHIIIIQKVLRNGVQLDLSGKLYNLTNTELTELFKMVKYVGYWDNFKKNIFTVNGMLYILDLEQPGNSSPLDFFHKNRSKYEWNTVGGIKEIADLIRPHSEQYLFFRQLVLNDPDLKQFTYYYLLQEHFNQVPKDANL
jgi:hypothetical protein